MNVRNESILSKSKGAHPPFVLTLSGSDSSGCAGMQADNRAIHAAGGFPLNVLTAITVQTPKGVEKVSIQSGEFVGEQISHLLESYPITAIKSGMLGNEDIATSVLRSLKKFPEIPYVLDPVMVSTSGTRLLEEGALEVFRNGLFHRATLITPNLDELRLLSGDRLIDPTDAARELAETTNSSVLLKGGHIDGTDCIDWLFTADREPRPYRASRIQSDNLRGTGCALSSAIAAYLGQGDIVPDAVHKGKELLSDRIRQGVSVHWVGDGPAFG